MIKQAVRLLSDKGADVAAISDVYTVSLPYYNCVAEITTALDKGAFVALTKEIEKEMGRTEAMKAAGEVPIDIDVVVFDGITLRPSDFSADYFVRGFSCVEN